MYELSAAATVVLLRQHGPDLELLLTERSKALGFAGGAMVFPGGKVDAGDLEIARNPALSIGFDDLADTDAAARVAAARESFEEVGIVLSTGPALDAATIAAWRARFSRVADADESATFAAFLEATGHRADAARMTPFSHWVPPAGLHRRFDTLFYITSVRDDEEAIPDGTETALVRWMTAAAALAAADAGELGVIFPTRRNLERLAQYPTLEALHDRLRELPLIRISPEMVERDGEKYLTIPTGCDYPITEERIATAMRG